jgi:HlyD family secretion protein
MIKILAVFLALGVAAFAGYTISNQLNQGRSPSALPAAAPQLPWVAAAPGKVEPKSGEIQIGASIPGRIAEVQVKVNDTAEIGELLIRLDDQEARARLAAAEAEAAVRKQERDSQPTPAGREDVRRAEDAVFSSERSLTGARFDLDRALAGRRGGTVTEQMLADSRRRFADARDRLQRDRLAVATALARSNVPAPSRLESLLSAARAEVAVAEALLDKTRIRSPIAGTVFRIHSKVGEIVVPSAELPLIVMGDLSLIRVKAEVDEGDASKIKLGQKAFVKSSSYPGREFEGKITALAPSLAAPRIGARGPRRPTDVDVLEVTIDLEGSVPLLPGMRVDAFFRRE